MVGRAGSSKIVAVAGLGLAAALLVTGFAGTGPHTLLDDAGTSSAGEGSGGAGALHAYPADEADAAASSHVPVKVTFGAHDYWIARLGHPAETAVASGPDGSVWLADDRRILVTTNGGETWAPKTLVPANGVIGVVPEGDIAVAPNGDVFTSWLAATHPHNNEMYVSTDGGTTFTYAPLVGPQGFPDRPWVTAGAAIGGDPDTYLVVTEAGTGIKPVWASNDRGLTWFLPTNQVPFGLLEQRPFPALPANPFMDFVKPLGQGFNSRLLALPGGEWFHVSQKLWTEDFVTWYSLPNGGLFGGGYPYWEASSDGTLYVAKLTNSAGSWKVQYQYYRAGTWTQGIDIPLSAEPKYLTGLFAGGTTPLLALKSCGGDLLGINTREDNKDVLIRIENANTPGATYTKETIGGGSNDRYDFPNLVFDTQCRAVMSFNSAWVAYATTP